MQNSAEEMDILSAEGLATDGEIALVGYNPKATGEVRWSLGFQPLSP